MFMFCSNRIDDKSPASPDANSTSKAMPVAQITIRLAPAVKAEFEGYAERLGLDASELAKLLIVRERNLRRLAALSSNETPRRRRRLPGSGGPLPTITAHLSTRAQVDDFDTYAKSCGLNRSGAGAWLLEKELQEMWLEGALSRE
jgi:hypothetical protein